MPSTTPVKPKVRDISEFIIRSEGQRPEYYRTDPSNHAEMVTLTIDVMNLHFSQVETPMAIRAIIVAIIGACSHADPDEEGWRTVSDRELAIRQIGENFKSANASKCATRRYRKRLLKWQGERGLQLVEVRPGKGKLKRAEGGGIETNWRGQKILLGTPTAYRLPVMESALGVVRDYQAARFKTAEYLKELVTRMQRELGFFEEPAQPEIDFEQKLARARRKVIADSRRLVDLTAGDEGDRAAIAASLAEEIATMYDAYVYAVEDDSDEYLN